MKITILKIYKPTKNLNSQANIARKKPIYTKLVLKVALIVNNNLKNSNNNKICIY